MSSVADRLRRLAELLPSDSAAVTLTRADLLELADADGVAEPDTRPDLSVEQVAAQVGRAPSTIRSWLIGGSLKGYKLPGGRTWRVTPAALREFRDRQTAGAPETTGGAADGDVDIAAWRKLRGGER